MCSSTSSHSDSAAYPGLESTLILESAVKNGGYKHERWSQTAWLYPLWAVQAWAPALTSLNLHSLSMKEGALTYCDGARLGHANWRSMATRSTQPSLIFAGTNLIYTLKNMNWMPLDGMPVLTNNFLLSYALLPYSHGWVICLSFEFLTPGFAMGCMPCSHPSLSQEAGCCRDVGRGSVGERMVHAPRAAPECSFCSWGWLHMGKKRPTDTVPKSSWLSFEVSWPQILHPLHPGRAPAASLGLVAVQLEAQYGTSIRTIGYPRRPVILRHRWS